MRRFKSKHKRIADLEFALRDAIQLIGEWGSYADAYFQEKWDLKGDIASLTAILDGDQ